jgi:hypothetical protein
VKKKKWANLQRVLELFAPKIVIKLSRSEIRDPGFGKTYSVSRGQKGTRSRILDTDCTKEFFPRERTKMVDTKITMER